MPPGTSGPAPTAGTPRAHRPLASDAWPLLVVPLLLVALRWVGREASGPFWLGLNQDPDYAYLFNSLALSQLQLVGHADHPGATLQLGGALVLMLTHATLGAGTLVQDVVQRPELYLHALHHAATVLAFGCTLAAGLIVWRATRDRVAAILLQSSPFVTTTAWDTLGRANPEPVLLSLSTLVAALAIVAAAGGWASRGRKRWPLGLGTLMGLGLALKTTFVPVMVLGPFVLRGVKQWLLLGVGVVVTFAVVAANPWMNVLGFLGFSTAFANRQGYNRPPDPTESLSASMARGAAGIWERLLNDDTGLLVALVACLLWLALAGRRLLAGHAGSAPPPGRRLDLLGVGFGAAIALQVLIVSVASTPHLRYLVPALPLVGGAFATAWLSARTARTEPSRGRALVGGVCLAVMAATALPLSNHLPALRQRVQRQLAAQSVLRAPELRELPVVTYYPASSPTYALAFGIAFSNQAFAPIATALHPGQKMLNRWTGDMTADFAETTTSLDQVLQQTPRILLHGGSLEAGEGLAMPSRQPQAMRTRKLFDNGEELVLLVELRGP